MHIFYTAQRRDCALIWQLSTSFTSTSRLCPPCNCAELSPRGKSEARAQRRVYLRISLNVPLTIGRKSTAFPLFYLTFPSLLLSSMQLFVRRTLGCTLGCTLVVGFCCSWLCSRLFSDQQRLHCSQPEHTGRIPTDVLYSTLWRICPF